MDRIDLILENKSYLKYMQEIETAEKTRRFCCHGFEHTLSVARIAYILALEHGAAIKKDVIYAAALLHDIGRYEKKQGHHHYSAVLAQPILETAGFNKQEILNICEAIQKHHEDAGEDFHSLNHLLYKADKLSRNCFCCKAYEDCYWDENKKNSNIKY